MRKIIILMLIILGFTSCEENGYAGDDAVYTVENVSVSPTTMTFKFRGVDKTQTFAIAACSDNGNYPSYGRGDVVKVKNCRVFHVTVQAIPVWGIVGYTILMLLIGFLIGVGVAEIN